MDIGKIIAKTEVDFLGGSPCVQRFWNEQNIKSIDILKCTDAPQMGVKTCATIGLNATNIGLVSDRKSLRVEILGVSDIKISVLENIVATTAFEIMDVKKCFPGYMIKNIINQYISNTEMKHVLITNPFLWENANSISVDEQIIAWLLIVPISDNEFYYAEENGYDELENIFEKENIDVFNLYRKSVI